ncbi:MAG: hypothetical protein HY318_12490 [Armatimonadetes bacterium]|nr:hypothetical protein [Armatimonadota bacterium]
MPRRRATAKKSPSLRADLRYQIEILLPVFYNDGREIEIAESAATVNELCDKFGGLRWSSASAPAPLEGLWRDAEQIYSDRLRTVIIETTHDNRLFRWLHTFKRKLETRFDQIEIYITVTEILRVL